MKYTASEIAEILDGFVVGDDDACVTSIAKIEEAQKGSLAFLANPKYTEFLYSTKASVTLVRDSFQPEKDISTTLVRLLILIFRSRRCFHTSMVLKKNTMVFITIA